MRLQRPCATANEAARFFGAKSGERVALGRAWGRSWQASLREDGRSSGNGGACLPTVASASHVVAAWLHAGAAWRQKASAACTAYCECGGESRAGCPMKGCGSSAGATEFGSESRGGDSSFRDFTLAPSKRSALPFHRYSRLCGWGRVYDARYLEAEA